MASNEILSTSAELFSDIPCDVCSQSGEHTEAEKRCFDCKQALCGTCLKDHDKFGITKGHRVLDLDTTVVGSIPNQMRNSQGEELVDVDLNHRRCDGIGYVPNINAEMPTNQEQNIDLGKMNDWLAKLQRMRKDREADGKRLADETESSERNVNEFVETIIARIIGLKENSLNQIQQQYDTFKRKIADDIRQISDAISLLEQDITVIKCLQSPLCDKDTQRYVTLKLNNENEERYSNLNSKMGNNLKREALYFNVDHEMEENMMNMKSLGELETPLFTSHSPGQIHSMSVMSDKKVCYITDICAMPDGTVLVTDWNNRKIKRLDSSYDVVDHCELPGSPYNICRTGPTEVAITLCVQQTIQFVSVTSSLTPTRSFRVGERCRGIAYSRGELFVTCGGYSKEGPGEMHVYSIDGKFRHNLPQKSADQSFWSLPLHVAVSPDGSTVIMSDVKHRLVTMNRDGSNAIKNLLGAGVDNLCVQDQSAWFACDAGQGEIVQFRDDGSILGALTVKNEIPSSVYYQRNGRRLIVGYCNSNFIQVFQLHGTPSMSCV